MGATWMGQLWGAGGLGVRSYLADAEELVDGAEYYGPGE